MPVKTSRKAFSLIEVLVFVSVVSLFFVSAAAVVAIILRNMKTDEHKILGTRYAEEAVEWLRSEKETDWNAFTARASNGIGTDYCIATLSWSSSPPCGNDLDNFYKRTLNLVSVSSADGFKYQVNAKIVVEWAEAGKIYTIPIDSVLSIWEQ
ncbi:MAG: hypothetical protein RI947_558 [Candidatus Parcubacteria bacterium]|jgi:type II secretory pathway pseudopilin PulG